MEFHILCALQVGSVGRGGGGAQRATGKEANTPERKTFVYVNKLRNKISVVENKNDNNLELEFSQGVVHVLILPSSFSTMASALPRNGGLPLCASIR